MIYHITHYKNLTSILKEGSILCKSLIREKSIVYKDVAYKEIQARRSVTNVPLEPYGTLHDYVPFSFAPRSPMLGAIYKNHQEGQRPMVHIVSSVQNVVQSGTPFVFTDGHATMALSNFYNHVRDLDKVDWEIMKSRFWADTPEDPDRKRRRQAEFLVYRRLHWSWVIGIGVIDEQVKATVMEIMNRFGCNLPVVVRKEWYYDERRG